jgi:hypothetical protein
LLVAASPPGFESVPLESHLLALRRAIDPWLSQDGTSGDLRSRIDEHLVVLPHASDEAIETACATGKFTHVHILAHGVEFQDGYDFRFGLALHDAKRPEAARAIVDGPRLATILRPSRRPGGDDLARPVVVTLASCNAGNQGSVAGAGASVAHALHEAGIPMVVAGQFPLSFEGSVRLVEVMYEGLLWGHDPRELLSDLRRRLHSQLPDNHDWASLVAYASLPSDLQRELTSVKITQAMRSINVAMALADQATRRYYPRLKKTEDDESLVGISDESMLEKAQTRVNVAKDKLAAVLSKTSTRWSEIYGYLASTEKRQAEILFSGSTRMPANSVERPRSVAESNRSLRRARDYYWEAFRHDRSSTWGVVQYLSLAIVLRGVSPSPSDAEPGEQNLDALWALAHTLSLQDLPSLAIQPRIWALSNLVELYLLARAMGPGGARPDSTEAADKALAHARELVAAAGGSSFEVYSTRRQMVRYVDWYAKLADLHDAPGLAERLVNVLPDSWNGQLGRPMEGPT